MRRVLVVALGGLLFLGACGGDDDDSEADAEDTASESESEGESGGDGDADAYIDAVAATMQEDEDTGMSLDEETARCVAAAGVNTIGVDALNEADVTPEELADAESIEELDVTVPDNATEDMAAALGECNLAETFAQVLVDSFASEGTVEMPEDAATCLGENIDEEALNMMLADSLITGAEGSEDFIAAALGACPTVLTELLVAGISAQTGTEMPQSARDCVAGYVEANAPSVAEGMITQSSEELFTGLTAACPELGSLPTGGG